MDAAARRLVWARAKSRCEYCRLHQDEDPYFRFHVEHIVPRQHGGNDDPENLALACHDCNEHKGTNLAGIDPDSGKLARLFNPRRQRWHRHFQRVGSRILGRTRCGRVTVLVLSFNQDKRMELREQLDKGGSPEPTSHFKIDLDGISRTEVLGRRLGQLLFPSALVALIGPLGAGKTQLVRAIAEGLDIPDPRVVSSPTFVLIQEYDARLPIYHFDVYRLRSEAEFAELGAHEYFDGDGVCLIEWADRVPSLLPAERLEARLEVVGETARRLELTAIGDRYRTLLGELERGAGR